MALADLYEVAGDANLPDGDGVEDYWDWFNFTKLDYLEDAGGTLTPLGDFEIAVWPRFIPADIHSE